MHDFRDQEYHILVATSVVEVGLDIPNATVILVESANRFGLAQLHQLRGRVGRSDAKSFCFLIPESEDKAENERLLAMVQTNDGFKLADLDLQQRGPGEFLGDRQSGFAELKMANITDVHLIEEARHQAEFLFDKDPDLVQPEHTAIKHNLKDFWKSGTSDIS
jgi:ATP-dependent DNA helicase RecG